jgi:hypothetical protein
MLKPRRLTKFSPANDTPPRRPFDDRSSVGANTKSVGSLTVAHWLMTSRRCPQHGARRQEFLDAAHAVPVAERSSEFAAWLVWALAHAAALDPLSRGAMVGKPLEPEPLGRADESGEQRLR